MNPLAPLPTLEMQLAGYPYLQVQTTNAITDFFTKPSGPSATPGCAWYDVGCNVSGAYARAGAIAPATVRDGAFLVIGIIVFAIGVWRLTQ